MQKPLLNISDGLCPGLDRAEVTELWLADRSCAAPVHLLWDRLWVLQTQTQHRTLCGGEYVGTVDNPVFWKQSVSDKEKM